MTHAVATAATLDAEANEDNIDDLIGDFGVSAEDLRIHQVDLYSILTRLQEGLLPQDLVRALELGLDLRTFDQQHEGGLTSDYERDIQQYIGGC